MRRVALIYNPTSGHRHGRRVRLIAEVEALLRAAGLEVKVSPTAAPGSAGELAQQAIDEGCDTILTCGGDGTAHEALQKMVGGTVALGVIPLGTANALAMDMGLPGSAVKAAKMLLTAREVRVPVGKVTYCDSEGRRQWRYFVVATGVGVDGVFFAGLDSKLKQRFGYAAYLAEALRLWATHTFTMFDASFIGFDGEAPRQVQASQILAVRISNFGGLVRKLAPGAALTNPHLHVIAIKTRSRLRYLRFMVAVWFRRHTYAEPLELVECAAVECSNASPSAPVSYVEADGELLGTLPARIEVVQEGLTLLIPRKR